MKSISDSVEQAELNGIEFDGYIIGTCLLDNGSLWLRWPSSEGMGISKERMKYWMDKIYEEDF